MANANELKHDEDPKTYVQHAVQSTNPVTVKLTRGTSKRNYGYEVRVEGKTVEDTIADLERAQQAMDELVDGLNGGTASEPPAGGYPMGSGRA